MNDGLALRAIIMLFDHCRPVPITITIVIPVTFSDGYAGTNRANPNTNVIGESRCGDSCHRSDNQSAFHNPLL
jgi:hypothetical protein